MYLTDRALKARFLTSCEQLHDGRLTLTTPEGETYRFGDRGPEAEMALRDWSAVSAMAARGHIGLGESYVLGLWDTASVEGLVSLAMRNQQQLHAFDSPTLGNRIRFRLVDTVLRANSRRGARRNIRSHYDVGNEFYHLWLDEGMTYSSALFDGAETDLAAGQQRKNTRALSCLSDGEQVLEIGCGWGGFAECAAEQGRHVYGVTISPAQHSYAEARLDGRAEIQLRDYRDIDGKYDNIVSIEMIEAVGARYWPEYFRVLKRSLRDGGRILLQAITVPDRFLDSYGKSSDFIRQYVFPGGMLLSEETIAKQAGAAGLALRSSYGFGQDYARTCRIWSERLVAQKRRIDALGHGEAFFRNWQYYLEICAAAFAMEHTNVVQVELAHA